MLRAGLAVLAVLGLSAVATASEMDREFKPSTKPKTGTLAPTALASTPMPASELDEESPTQACRWYHRGWGGWGWRGGWGWGGGWRGGWGRPWGWGWGVGYGWGRPWGWGGCW
ncbi:MAG TPA: hypothetical protein PKC45_11235 [Gemmatales bacterium]|nr:hypothetical protein [Gemmatales bacterium]